MPGLVSAVRQERSKKGGAHDSVKCLLNVGEEDLQMKNTTSWQKGTDLPEKLDSKGLPVSSVSVLSLTGNSSTGLKPGRLFLKTNERHELAQERRKECEKQLAKREVARLQREEKARRHREEQLAERRRRLTEQRQRAERRRAAAEEKRRQKLLEETERHRAVVQRTLERSRRGANHMATHRSGRARQFSRSIGSKSDCPVTATPLRSLQGAAMSRLDNAMCRETPRKTGEQDNGKKIHSRSSIAMTTTGSVTRATPAPTERSTPDPSIRSVRRVKISPVSHGEGQEKVSVRRPTPEPPASEPAAPEPATVVQLSGGSAQAVLDTAPPPASLCPSRPQVGATDPERAARLLADRRRLAREQRDEEEEEHCHREEAERNTEEEKARRSAVDRAKQEEEAVLLAEERRKREEEEKHAEEERRQNEREEAERLQKQREEEEQLQLEKEIHFQKEEAERIERKKRLEEIMKRTRRTSPAEKRALPDKSGDCPQRKPELSSLLATWVQSKRFQGPVCNGENNLSSSPPPAGQRSSSTDGQPIENRVSVHSVINMVMGRPELELSREESGVHMTAYRRLPTAEATVQHG